MAAAPRRARAAGCARRGIHRPRSRPQRTDRARCERGRRESHATVTRTDLLIAGAIVVAVSVVTLAASTRQGITRDEAYYMDAGERYVRYIEDTLSGSL